MQLTLHSARRIQSRSLILIKLFGESVGFKRLFTLLSVVKWNLLSKFILERQ